jgi:NTP pyrophosphatase (non-canonical NTP hydrolase)
MQLDSIKLILAERERQNFKFGEQNHSPEKWAVILGEEYGEVCRAILDAGFAQGEIGGLQDYKLNLQKLKNELVEVAAVAIAALESLERNEMQEENMPPDIFGDKKEPEPKFKLEKRQASILGLIDDSNQDLVSKTVKQLVEEICNQKDNLIREKLEEKGIVHLLEDRDDKGIFKNISILREGWNEHWIAYRGTPEEVRIITFVNKQKELDYKDLSISLEIEYY